MKAAERFFSFLMGFFIYSLIEIAARGYTHWTMALTGGLQAGRVGLYSPGKGGCCGL